MKKLLLAVAAVLVAVLAPIGAHYLGGAIDLLRASKPRTTVARMRDLMGVLLSHEPKDLTPAALASLLESVGRSECKTDGWGSAFLIERIPSRNQEIIYRITSLGKDLKRGGCCRRWTDSFEEDAVLESTPEGMAWRQQWTFGRRIPEAQGDGAP
jgi:hypothetical protein